MHTLLHTFHDAQWNYNGNIRAQLDDLVLTLQFTMLYLLLYNGTQF